MPPANKEQDVEALRKEVKELRDMVEKTTIGKVKKTRKKNPDAKPNPYLEFSKERRAHFTKEGLHKDKSMTEISKIIGQEWQEDKKKKSSD